MYGISKFAPTPKKPVVRCRDKAAGYSEWRQTSAMGKMGVLVIAVDSEGAR